ncbi:hypothetical protein [Pseudomonas chlororaphis]|uniref:hypothetical protein n=1 Tax=Pseudomonas chlororaphis TaxID=587753 RepID=UPI0006A63EF6|nr:hypothetical protein [Pseudomonas chlororaphis]AZD00675.1 hypothetical protein C4K27_1466 [Pseudomonas chlororaphis subsp. chlororaphis]MBM0283427.1 hypothetical protein [Pseudomonas chlororaphis]MDO1503754.1 hypothetical protein [Pseudomonas chlororaphis]ORM48818.1 hypothetical protein B6D51_04950 [Pseudomonas chlororaphis subsp. chlororaphis]TWR95082.1 hypothetical protein FJD36_18760 [Pseudomonas chlororaphis subsp. chlororaphis]
MKRPIPLLRLSPEAAGELQEKCTKATTELQELSRFRKEFDRQLAVLIGADALRELRKTTEHALLLADLVKEAA